MSSKSDEDQVIVDKIRTYPHLTVNTSTPKLTVPTENTESVSTASTKNISRSNHSISIVPTSGSQDFDETQTTCAELKQAVQRKKLPPYTNVPSMHAPSRVTRVTQPKTPPKKTPQKLVSHDKFVAESYLSSASIANNKSIMVDPRTNANINSVPALRTAQSSPVQPRGNTSEKVMLPGASTPSETSCATQKILQDQVLLSPSSKSTNDVFERNINKNVLTLTPCASSAKSASVVKETKASPIFTTNSTPAKSVSPSSTHKNTTPMKDNSNNNSPKSAGKFDVHTLSPCKSVKTASNNTFKQVMISTADLASRSLIRQSPNIDSTIASPSKMKDVTTTTVSSSDGESQVADLNSKIIPSKIVPSTISSCIKNINPKTTTISVSSSSSIPFKKTVISESSQMSTVSMALPNSRLALIVSETEGKKMRDVLNAGSTLNLTNSVTISNQTGADSKSRNVSGETIVQPFPKQMFGVTSSSTASSCRGKSGNAEIIGGGNPHQSGSSPKDSSPSATRELRSSRKESVTMLQKSQTEDEDASIDNRQKDTAHGDIEVCDKPHPTRKAAEQSGVVECLTISSDEDDDEDEEAEESEPHVSSFSDASDISTSLMNKEPPLIDAYDDAKFSDSEMNLSEREFAAELDPIYGDGYYDLHCRTVRIGSYKFYPQSPVVISDHGVRMDVPVINRPSETIVMKIPIDEITKVLIHAGRKLPVMFYYVSMQMGARVRKLLNMTKKSEYYFNPHSKDDSQRRITLVLENLFENNGTYIAEIYLERHLLEDLSYKEANALLVKSSPRERKDVHKPMKQVPPNPVQTIMVYPPPPARGGISINTEDYSCLAEDVFLNDVIIDFYLKWLYNEKLSEADREKTHIFSSFFYKRLTDKATPIPRDLQNSRATDTTISPAEIRHSRVSKWTKNIDLFSKDYIIIPLNENQHWFLAIICFPGLSGPVRFADNKPIESPLPEVKIENADSSTENADSQTMFIGSTTITPIRQDAVAKFAVIEEEGGDADERDEADGTEEDIHLFFPLSEDSEAEYSESELTSSGDVKPAVTRIKSEKEPIKQPCILVFDSLAGASRARIIATLRDYLRVEYKAKHNEERDFSKHVVKGACPRVPQQNNYTDCGLFVLQYVESFFENKIADFQVPIKSLRNWFDPDEVGSKRYAIQQLLIRLMHDQNIDVSSLKLPSLNLSVRSGDDSNEDYDFGDDDYYDDDDEQDDFEDDDDMDDVDGDGDLNHPFQYDISGDCHDGRTFRGQNLKRIYTLQNERSQQRRLRSHQQSAREAAYMNEVVADDEDDLEGYDDDASRDFGLYGEEFDVHSEDSHDEDVDANEVLGDADLYEDLDEMDDVPKRRSRAANADSSGFPSRSRGTVALPPAGRGRRSAPPPGKATRRMPNPQLVSYDDDDDDEEDVDAVDGGLVHEDDALHHVDDGEEDEVEDGLCGMIEEDEAADAECERQLALANERLCGLNPESVTVSLMPRQTPASAKKANSPSNPSTASSATSERSQSLDALKAARPFGEIESTDSPCSLSKKFRSN